MKAKLHLSMSLLPIFTFNQAKKLLDEIKYKVFDAALENNMFSNSVNPLLSMCLVCELCSKISKKFFSLSYPCRQAVDKVKELMIEFIQVINDENFLTNLLHEKDY